MYLVRFAKVEVLHIVYRSAVAEGELRKPTIVEGK